MIAGNGEWGMGNGEWGMGNGEWGMGNGEWGMGNGKMKARIKEYDNGEVAFCERATRESNDRQTFD